MRRFRKISTCVMAVLLIACIGYFSVVSPTSAWFYDQNVIDSGDSFIFGDLSVDASFTRKSNIVFDAATDFTDPAETLFDDVVFVNEIPVRNSGTIPARIYTDVKNSGKAPGLRWFWYTEDQIVDGSVKKTIESVIPSMTDAALNEYNVGKDGKTGHYVTLYPGEITMVYVAAWIDYDSVKAELEKGKTLSDYNITLKLTATQDVDGAYIR